MHKYMANDQYQYDLHASNYLEKTVSPYLQEIQNLLFNQKIDMQTYEFLKANVSTNGIIYKKIKD